MKEHAMEPNNTLKEKHIKSIYEISEIMMKEARIYIENGQLSELEDILNKGFFADVAPNSSEHICSKDDEER